MMKVAYITDDIYLEHDTGAHPESKEQHGIRKIVGLILDSANIPMVFFFEGCYDVNALGENVKVTVDEMLKVP